jgi:hypothetical protein
MRKIINGYYFLCDLAYFLLRKHQYFLKNFLGIKQVNIKKLIVPVRYNGN